VVRDSKGKVLFRVAEDGDAVIVTVWDALANNKPTAAIESSGGRGVLTLSDPSRDENVRMGINSFYQPDIEFEQGGVRQVQLGPGTAGTMGLRIWKGPAGGPEVVTLEDLPGGDGGGGLMIHNASGGTAATIVPNKDGVGVFHGIAVPLMP
jgi:hypothetical protein